ncbi:hypothetical protein TNCV_120401 [Trichonephila clavipes]|nr:hypothetical protein TNCV_120401 [Trichonephila clavipes]
MFDSSSYDNPTPLAHADASRDVLPRGGVGHNLKATLRTSTDKHCEILKHIMDHIGPCWAIPLPWMHDVILGRALRHAEDHSYCKRATNSTKLAGCPTRCPKGA